MTEQQKRNNEEFERHFEIGYDAITGTPRIFCRACHEMISVVSDELLHVCGGNTCT